MASLLYVADLRAIAEQSIAATSRAGSVKDLGALVAAPIDGAGYVVIHLGGLTRNTLAGLQVAGLLPVAPRGVTAVIVRCARRGQGAVFQRIAELGGQTELVVRNVLTAARLFQALIDGAANQIITFHRSSRSAPTILVTRLDPVADQAVVAIFVPDALTGDVAPRLAITRFLRLAKAVVRHVGAMASVLVTTVHGATYMVVAPRILSGKADLAETALPPVAEDTIVTVVIVQTLGGRGIVEIRSGSVPIHTHIMGVWVV